MRITLEAIMRHPITQKYLTRSGLKHAVDVCEHALELATKRGLDTDLATKAALLHDIGHYEWYTEGKWNYELYRQNDIHAIKGAERAHKLLVRLGEDPSRAKEIAVMILLHTDSYLPPNRIQRTPLQQLVHEADSIVEQPGGMHHYETMDLADAIEHLKSVDEIVERLSNLPRISNG